MSNLTIPADQLVNIIPGVLAAGGNALQLSGVLLTQSTLVPIGTAPSFATAANVGAYFGLNSNEYQQALVYFAGFTNRTAVPAAMLAAQYNSVAVAAYVRGASIAALTIAQLQALSGTLSVVMDGYTYSNGSVNLSGDTSFSAAAATIQTALNASPPAGASFTGALGAAFTGNASGANLTTTAVTGVISVGDTVTGTGVPANTTIISQTSGTTGGAGVYVTSQATTASSAACTCASNVLVVTADTGTVQPFQLLVGVGVTVGTTIVSQISGTSGGAGSYQVSAQFHVVAESMTTTAPALAVFYSSINGGLTIASGSTGANSTAAFPTGTLAPGLNLTSALGAVLSQGAAAASPAAFMTALTGVTQNWASFWTNFDPDGGSGNTQKKALAAWNSLQNDRWVYVAWDTDVTPTQSTNAASSLGQYLITTGASGTIAIWTPSDLHHAPFVAGMIASINFNATNGRITMAGKGQAGLQYSVTNATVALNLIANGYNFVGIYSTADQTFDMYQPGSISGPFAWADAYVDDIWLTNQFQLSGMLGLQAFNSIPYNASGQAIVESFFVTPIDQAVTFGAVQSGVALSAEQVLAVNTAAGAKIDTVLFNQGWYLQVLVAPPATRAVRGSFPINFWYTDGGAVQKISMSSIDVQ